MNADDVRMWLERQPFEAFEIELSSGDRYRVLHPELLALGKNRLYVVNRETDRVAFLSMLHVSAILPLQQA